MINVFLFFLVTISSHFCCGFGIDYSSFESIEEVIEFESLCILNASSLEEHSESYASRGESLLLCGLYKESIDDLQQAYFFAHSINDEEASQLLEFRVLFDQAIAYGNLDDMEMVIYLTDRLKEMMRAVTCNDCVKVGSLIKPISYSKNNAGIRASILMCSDDVPIYGPDQISIRDCIDFVNNTVSFSKLLIAKAPPSVRALLSFTIDQLADQSRSCCRSGKGWKGCVQNLANKYHLWNQKWKAFGIPPDPAWD